MFKRIFWMGLGVTAGVVLVTKAEAYVRANTPKRAREFVLGEDQDQVASRKSPSVSSIISRTRIIWWFPPPL